MIEYGKSDVPEIDYGSSDEPDVAIGIADSAPQIQIDPETIAKKRTSEVFGTIFGLDEPTTIATYDTLVKNMYGEGLKPSRVQQMMEEDGFQINADTDEKDVTDFSNSMLNRKDSPIPADRQRREANRQIYNVFQSLQLADDIIFDPENEWYKTNIATKPKAREGVVYSEPAHETEDLLDFDTYASLLEQASTQGGVEDLRRERKALLAQKHNEAFEQNRDYYERLRYGQETLGSKFNDVWLEASKGLVKAVYTIERGMWSTSTAMGMAWNQPSLDDVDEALRNAALTPSEAAGKIGYVTGAMSEAIPSFAYNMAVGNAGIFITEYGNARREALDDGATDLQSNLIAIPVATINTIIEGFQIGQIFKIAGLGKGAKQAIKQQIKDRAYKAFLKSGAKFTGQSVAASINEGIEGFAQEGVSIAVPGFIIGNYPKDENGRIDWTGIMSRMSQSFVGEGLGGLLLGTGGAVYNARNVQNYKHDIAFNLITNEGMESKQALEIATNIVERLRNNEASPKEIYREEVGKVKKADNRAKAAAHVIKRGKEMPDEQYRQIALDTTGKDSMVDMTYEEGEKFIEALNKAKVEKAELEEGQVKEEVTEQQIAAEIEEIKQEGEVVSAEKPLQVSPEAKVMTEIPPTAIAPEARTGLPTGETPIEGAVQGPAAEQAALLKQAETARETHDVAETENESMSAYENWKRPITEIIGRAALERGLDVSSSYDLGSTYLDIGLREFEDSEDVQSIQIRISTHEQAYPGPVASIEITDQNWQKNVEFALEQIANLPAGKSLGIPNRAKIADASIEKLNAWADAYGIQRSSNPTELRERIADFFGKIKPAPSQPAAALPAPAGKAEAITIEALEKGVLPRDKTITLTGTFFHNTDRESAETIKKSGFKVEDTSGLSKAERGLVEGNLGAGVYLSPDYAQNMNFWGGESNLAVTPKRPLKLYSLGSEEGTARIDLDKADEIKKQGYDGIIVNDPHPQSGGYQIVVFDPANLQVENIVEDTDLSGEELAKREIQPAAEPAPITMKAYRAETGNKSLRPSKHYAVNRKMAQPEIPPGQPIPEYVVKEEEVTLQKPLVVEGLQGNILDKWAAEGDIEAQTLIQEADAALASGKPKAPDWFIRADTYIAKKAQQLGYDGIFYNAGERSEIVTFPAPEAKVAEPAERQAIITSDPYENEILLRLNKELPQKGPRRQAYDMLVEELTADERGLSGPNIIQLAEQGNPIAKQAKAMAEENGLSWDQPEEIRNWIQKEQAAFDRLSQARSSPALYGRGDVKKYEAAKKELKEAQKAIEEIIAARPIIERKVRIPAPPAAEQGQVEPPVREPPQRPSGPKQSFAIYKRMIPNATEEEVVRAMLEDDQPVPERILEKYEDMPEAAERLEQIAIDRRIAERAKELREIKPPRKTPKKRTRGLLDNTPFGNKDKLQQRVDEVMSLAEKPEHIPAEEKKKSLKELKRTDTLTTFKNVAEDAVKGIDRAFGIMSTRIKNISLKLFQEVRNKYVNPVKMIIADRTQKVHPFVDGIGKLSDADAYDFEVARWTGDIDTVERIIQEQGLQEAYNKYRLVFDLMYHEGKAVGMDMNYMTAYFPSKVKDLDGLLKELNRREEYAPIVKALAEAQDKKGRPLAKEEQVQVLDTLLRGYRTTGVSLTPPGFTRIRTLIRDDIGLIKYYYGFAETSSRYIESMTENIQARKFFGKQTKDVVQLRANISRQKTNIAKWEKDTEKDRTKNIQDAKDKLQQYEMELLKLDDGTLNASIGGYVLDLITDGTINYDQQVELRQIFEGLFNTLGSNRWVHTLRSLEYVGSLAQIPALVTQYSEVILSVLKAPGTTLPNWVRAHLNQSKIKLRDIGVAHIGQEWADADLDNTMTSLMKTFEKVDKVGKETFINSVVDKYRKLAKTNPDKVKEELSKYYPEGDHAAIIESLISGVVDNNIKGFALNELADVQPISKMEVPELYAKAGNLRVFYMYKTFTLKRLDILRNQAYTDIKTGIKSSSPRQVLKGLAKLLWLALMFTLADSSADVVKDIIRGKPLQNLPDYVVDNLLQMILLSKYAANKVRAEGVSSFFRDNITLPVSTIDAAARDVSTLMDEDSEKGSELARRIPWIGDLYYWHMGEGARKVEEGYYD